MLNNTGSVLQSNQYYPFGMEYADGKGKDKQPYKYGGKELDSDHNLNLYDFAARYYDPAIPRFTSIDPLAQIYYSISPYAYVMNNPLKYIDPTGMYPEDDQEEGLLQGIFRAFNQMMNLVAFDMGIHPRQLDSENSAVRQDAKQRREVTQEVLHTANETMLSVVPGAEITYKALNDREISASDYGWAAAELTPIGKFSKQGRFAKNLVKVTFSTKSDAKMLKFAR